MLIKILFHIQMMATNPLWFFVTNALQRSFNIDETTVR